MASTVITRAHYWIRLKLNFIFEFTALSIILWMVAYTINSFCIELYCRSMSVEVGLFEVFGGKREFSSKYPAVLMECDPRNKVREMNG